MCYGQTLCIAREIAEASEHWVDDICESERYRKVRLLSYSLPNEFVRGVVDAGVEAVSEVLVATAVAAAHLAVACDIESAISSCLSKSI